MFTVFRSLITFYQDLGHVHKRAILLKVLARADLRGVAGRVRIPTLVVAGEYDRLTPPAAGAWLASHIPGARHCPLAGASHAPFLSHPDEFLAALDGFLPAPARHQARA